MTGPEADNSNVRARKEGTVVRLMQACVLFLVFALVRPACAAPSDYFAIEVIDAQTGRGVPLVELRTTNGIRFYTDSAGLVAFNQPGLMDRDVFFFVSSHGYKFPADGFGMRGTALHTTPGASAKIEIERVNIAERLYRITGQGIYRDTVLLGRLTCTLKPRCTPDRIKRLKRWQHEDVLDKMQARLDRMLEAMTIRRQTAERPFQASRQGWAAPIS